MLYCSWDIACDGCNYFFISGNFFLYPPSSLKNENFFKKMKKMPGDVIILHKSTKNYDHMVYCSWYMARDECNFVNFHFGLFFALKNENFKKNEKKPLIYHHFTQVYQKSGSYVYCSWDMACNGCNCYFSFWAIFCLFTPLTAQIIKILKDWKKTPGDIILHMCTKNYD